MEAQIRELLTRYGDVADIWFDGEWEHTTQEMRSNEVYDMIRKLQPNTLINDRLFKREPGNKADFGTPEQYVPATGLTDPSGKPIFGNRASRSTHQAGDTTAMAPSSARTAT